MKRAPLNANPADLPQRIEAARAVLDELAQKSPRTLLAYSGGKDSLVVCHMAREHLGLRDAVLEGSFGFPRFLRGARQQASDLGLNVTEYARLDEAWLRRHPQYICTTPNVMGRFYGLRQQATIREHALRHGYTGVVLGRRTQENTVPSTLYQTRHGTWQCNPIRDWRAEHVWGYLEAHGIAVPEIYRYPLGQSEGSTSWNTCCEQDILKRHGRSNLELIAEFDPEHLPVIARVYPAAQRFIEERGL